MTALTTLTGFGLVPAPREAVACDLKRTNPGYCVGTLGAPDNWAGF